MLRISLRAVPMWLCFGVMLLTAALCLGIVVPQYKKMIDSTKDSYEEALSVVLGISVDKMTLANQKWMDAFLSACVAGINDTIRDAEFTLLRGKMILLEQISAGYASEAAFNRAMTDVFRMLRFTSTTELTFRAVDGWEVAISEGNTDLTVVKLQNTTNGTGCLWNVTNATCIDEDVYVSDRAKDWLYSNRSWVEPLAIEMEEALTSPNSRYKNENVVWSSYFRKTRTTFSIEAGTVISQVVDGKHIVFGTLMVALNLASITEMFKSLADDSQRMFLIQTGPGAVSFASSQDRTIGSLLAASNGLVYSTSNDSTDYYQRITPTDSTDSIISGSGAYVDNVLDGENWASLSRDVMHEVVESENNTKHMLLATQITRSNGIHWTLAVTVPRAATIGAVETTYKTAKAEVKSTENDVEAEQAQSHIILVVFLVAFLVFTVFVSFHAARLYTRELIRLRDDMEAVAHMELESIETLEATSVMYEVASMQYSLLEMVSNLKVYRSFMPRAVTMGAAFADAEDGDQNDIGGADIGTEDDLTAVFGTTPVNPLDAASLDTPSANHGQLLGTSATPPGTPVPEMRPARTNSTSGTDSTHSGRGSLKNIVGRGGIVRDARVARLKESGFRLFEVTLVSIQLPSSMRKACGGSKGTCVMSLFTDRQQFVQHCLDVIESSDGVVHSVSDGCVVGAWNTYRPCAGHEVSALRLALAIRDTLDTCKTHASATIVVSGGPALVGFLGSNALRTPVVMGTPFHVLDPLHKLGELIPSGVLVTEAVAQKVRSRVNLVPIDNVRMMDITMRVYEALPLNFSPPLRQNANTSSSIQLIPTFEDFASEYLRGFSKWLSLEYGEALKHFETFVATYGSGICHRHLRHTIRLSRLCALFSRTPPAGLPQTPPYYHSDVGWRLYEINARATVLPPVFAVTPAAVAAGAADSYDASSSLTEVETFAAQQQQQQQAQQSALDGSSNSSNNKELEGSFSSAPATPAATSILVTNSSLGSNPSASGMSSRAGSNLRERVDFARNQRTDTPTSSSSSDTDGDEENEDLPSTDSKNNNSNKANSPSSSAAAALPLTSVPAEQSFQTTDGVTYYKSSKVLGKGATSEVRLGMSSDGALVALKCCFIPEKKVLRGADRLRRQSGAQVDEIEMVIDEVNMLSTFRHDNIVAYLGAAVIARELVIVTEFVSGGSLASTLETFGKIPVVSLKRYIRDILHGLAYLHSNEIAHRDVKPHNVLLMIDGQCKITDFGASARMFSNKAAETSSDDSAERRSDENNSDNDDTNENDEKEHRRSLKGTVTRNGIVGTPLYMAPEAASGNATTESDIWSFGVMTAELLTGRLPYPPERKTMPFWQFVFTLGRDETFVPSLSEAGLDPMKGEDDVAAQAIEFLMPCFSRDPTERPTAEALLRHSFLM
eukprot:PhM_4_TR3824/c0_g1_i1/m.43833/K17533/MAP3K19, YSK4; mitogen-activated protein kinase kinase kinase 19